MACNSFRKFPTSIVCIAVLYAIFRNDLTTEMFVLNEQYHAEFEFTMSLRRYPTFSQALVVAVIYSKI